MTKHDQGRESGPSPRTLLLVLNVFGGTAVLASYWFGLAAHPGQGDALWGGVPEWLRPAYTVSMFTAAAGYFPLSYALVLHGNPAESRFGPFGWRALALAYALVLVPAALWLPLTFLLIDGGWSDALWMAVRAVLALTAAGSLGLFAAAAGMKPSPSPLVRRFALVGALAFCIQTVALDATVWTLLFPVPPAQP